MKSFQDLKLIGSNDEQKKLISLIEQKLKNGWSRNRDRELELKVFDQYIVFTYSNKKLKSAADLSLVHDENGILYVANITPHEQGGLGEDTYNLILNEFLTKFVEPAAIGLNIRIVVSSTEITIDNSMSPDMSQLLKTFSGIASKSSGRTHTFDQIRFFDFIIQAHSEKSLLDETTLNDLLLDDGWSEEYADELSCKYNFGRKLLKHTEIQSEGI
jgi:hypothetical protein